MPRIALTSVTKTFGQDAEVRALEDVDLIIEQGDFVAIEGPSGSGKSTLLNVITALDTPTHGAYLLGGVSVSSLREADRSRLRSNNFGFVFQSFHLMPRRSALDNVALGLLYRGIDRNERRRRARLALVAVGLETRVDTPVRKLSGGECQRVAIARATLGDSPVIVADEPTGNLDSANSELVMAQLAAIAVRGATVIVVTHDRDIAAAATRRVQVRDGRVTERVGTGRSPAPATTFISTVPGKPSRLRCGDLVREAFAALASRPGRSVMLLGAVMAAVGLVVATSALAQSASSQVSDRFDARRNRDVTVDVPLRFATSAAPVTDLPVDYERRLGRVAGIDEVGLVEQRGRVGAHSQPLMADQLLDVVAISTDALTALDAHVNWASAHRPSLGPGEVLLGVGAAATLELGPVELDPAVLLAGRQYTVVGTIRSARRMPSLVNAVVTGGAWKTTLGQVEKATLYLGTAAGAAPQVARQAPVALDPIDDSRFEAHAPIDPSTLRDEIQGDVRSTLTVLSILAALASVLGVANAMMLGVLERVGELGLRRAIGARPMHVFAQTSVESLLIGAGGGLLGLLAGLAGVLGVTIVRGWTPVFDLRLAPAAILGGLLVGGIGGSAASFRASRVQPADALRQ